MSKPSVKTKETNPTAEENNHFVYREHKQQNKPDVKTQKRQ